MRLSFSNDGKRRFAGIAFGCALRIARGALRQLGMTGGLLRCYLNPRELSVAQMGSSFGQLFRITTWGESHGGGVGVVIDGCPPRIELSEEDIQRDLDRRRPGQSEIVTT